jgi:FkbM family methyltransferase
MIPPIVHVLYGGFVVFAFISGYTFATWHGNHSLYGERFRPPFPKFPPLLLNDTFPHSSQVFSNVIQSPIQVRSFPKRIYIDLGANCGNSYALFKERIDEAHLFEPQPAVFEDWLKPLAASTPGVNVYWAAISDSDGQLDFFVDGKFPSKICTFHQGYPHGASSVFMTNAGPGSEKVKVKSVDIAQFLHNILSEQGASKPYLIVKIDIEGMETRILNRLRSEKLLCLVKELLIEWHCTTGPGCRPENHDVMFSQECPGINYTEWII